MNLFDYFIDPVLRGPTVGSMLMGLSASVVGVLVFLQKKSLTGETLSHAAYPGVILGALLTSFLLGTTENDSLLAVGILAGAFAFAWLGLITLKWIGKTGKVKADSALCFVLASFFGFGITLASLVQFTHTTIYKQALNYLLGQPATMTDSHIQIYGALSLLVVSMVALFFKEIQGYLFDASFAKAQGIASKLLEPLITVLVALSVVIGIRSTGVVLMSAMLIAPAISARQFTNRLSLLFILAPLFGIASAFLGSVLSYEITKALNSSPYSTRMVLPMGPMIVLVASLFATLALLFAKERGIVPRLFRAFKFRQKCTQENLLKTLWKVESKTDLASLQSEWDLSRSHLSFVLWLLKRQELVRSNLTLTEKGEARASEIVRLHRLWELYLVKDVGIGKERVHVNAEEMEHILTEEFDEQLTELLDNPVVDPHSQPIPPKED